MAENTIESLPEEILIEIFNYLSPKMVKTCCAASKRFVCEKLYHFVNKTMYIMTN